jgi:hypothetical protein
MPAPAKTNAASIQFPMRCHSVACWYAGPNAVSNAIGYAEHFSRSHDAMIRVYDDADNVIETHEHRADLRECRVQPFCGIASHL